MHLLVFTYINVLLHQKDAPSPVLRAPAHAPGKSFVEKLNPEALKYFSEVATRPFSQQAVTFLNAYWSEVREEAEFIYT